MNPLSSYPRRWLARLRRWFAEAAERAADAVKDFMLDWGAAEPPCQAAHALPRVPPEQLVAALRGRVEQTLLRVADAINRAPTGDIVAASEEEVRGLFGELWWDALELGAKMRVEAGLSQLPPVPGGSEGWAAKYRRMCVEEGRPPFTYEAEPAELR